MKRKVLTLFALCMAARFAYCQNGFCDGVKAIMNDAPNRFKNVRGKVLDARPGAGMWASSIKVPGMISERFVSSMGNFYEGAIFQAATKEGIGDAYEKAKAAVNECLAPLGYKVSYQDNFYPGMSDYKKVVYMQPITADTKIGSEPAHATIEAQYSKDTRSYSVVMFIYEH
jgi:hypothetical protein